MRRTPEEIGGNRAARSAEIVLTGGTGFVGSHLAASLIRAGHKLRFLCRSKDGRSSAVRVRRVLEWHGLELADESRVIESDLSQPSLGLSGEAFRRLAEQTDEIIHCASHTSFAEKQRREIYETNVNGTVGVLDLVEAGNCGFFHYISTAYAVGKASGACPESIGDGNGFYNPYESSKNEAEQLVTCRCSRSGVRAAIYRPSIVIGDSTHGRTLLFNAMYYPIKVIQYLANEMRKDLEENEGHTARRVGAELEPDGRVRLPIRVDAGTQNGGVLNVIPIDFVVNGFRALFDRNREEGVFHLVNKSPATVDELLTFAQTYFGITGLSACHSDVFRATPKTALERRFDAFNRVYLPYMSDTRRFDTSRADAILEPVGVTCPKIDYELFRRCIDYAVHCDWSDPTESL